MNAGVLRLRLIDDDMPFHKAVRGESLDFIQEHTTAVEKVNILSVRYEMWHIDVFSFV